MVPNQRSWKRGARTQQLNFVVLLDVQSKIFLKILERSYIFYCTLCICIIVYVLHNILNPLSILYMCRAYSHGRTDLINTTHACRCRTYTIHIALPFVPLPKMGRGEFSMEGVREFQGKRDFQRQQPATFSVLATHEGQV